MSDRLRSVHPVGYDVARYYVTADSVTVEGNAAMAAPEGNQFWRVRSSHGRSPKFESADVLWAACVEYFECVEANPLLEDTLVTYQGQATHAPLAKMRAMTIAGLCLHLDISQEAWGDYRKRDGFTDITSRVDATIRTQKFEGAAAGLLHANLIARDLGLTDRTQLNEGAIHIHFDALMKGVL